MNAFFLAFHCLKWSPLRSSIMIAVGAIILIVPLVTRILLVDVEDHLMIRAAQTPLVLGPQGSQLDLAMASLYFAEGGSASISAADEESIWDSGLGLPIPLYTNYRASGFPIVGTSLDYLDFRDLEVSEGRRFAVLGEVVVGSKVAATLGLEPNGTLVSSPVNLFDLDGSYPLEMTVSGILGPTGTADDEAIFTDIKTTWIIAGIGHGHNNVILSEGAGTQSEFPKVETSQVITSENLDSFHFHGDPESYPLSAVLVVPHDLRSSTILKGRYYGSTDRVQLIVPEEVLKTLVSQIFQIAKVVDAIAAIVGVSSFGALALAFYLSWSLREREMALARKLGADSWGILRMALAEITVLLGSAALLALSVTLFFKMNSGVIIKNILSL